MRQDEVAPLHRRIVRYLAGRTQGKGGPAMTLVDTIRQIEDTPVFFPLPDWFFCRNLCDMRTTCDYK